MAFELTQEDYKKMGQGIGVKPLTAQQQAAIRATQYLSTPERTGPQVGLKIPDITQPIPLPVVQATPPLTQNASPIEPSAPEDPAEMGYKITRPVSIGKAGKDLEKEEERLQKEAINNITAQATNEAETQARINQQQIEYNRQVIKDNEEAQARQDRRLTLMQEATDNLQQAMNEFSSTKVDPNHFWSERTPPEKITAIIAIALGAAGSALAGTPQNNTALRIIERAIDLDIDAQKTELMKKGDVVSQKRNLLSDLEKTSRTEQERDAQAKILKYEAFKTKLDEIAATSKVPQIVLKAEALKNQIQQEQTAKKLKDLQAAVGVEEVLKKPGVTGAEKKTISEGMLEKIANTKSALKNIDMLEKAFDTFASKASSFGAGSIPIIPTDTKRYNDVRGAAVITVGNFLNGLAELSPASREEHLGMLPKAGQPVTAAKSNFQQLRELVQGKLDSYQEILGSQGYKSFPNTQRNQSSDYSGSANRRGQK